MGSMFGTGVVVWVYCGKQFLVLKCVLWVALLILRGYVGVHVWYCGNKKIVGQGGITAEHRAQPKRTTQKRGEDAWSCANSKLSFLVLFPLPFPLPPGRKCRPSPWAGLHFAQGGGGMGGGIAPGLPLRIPKMRHPRKLRKKKLHIIYLKGTHKKKGAKKKNFRVAVLVQGGLHFWYRGW